MLRTRENAIVLSGLAAITLVSWAYLVLMARDMSGDTVSCMVNMTGHWTPAYFWMTFIMWAIMMVGMMVPSVTPMVLAFTTISRKRTHSSFNSWLFLTGYLAVWTAFSLAATLAQWGLHSASLLSAASLKVAPVLGALLLVSAGAYQWTPWKNSCLAKCATPLGFLLSEWREGGRGALVMGIRHGWFCTGCCALVMVLLFVAGVMNLLWVALLAAVVLIEKIAPAGRVTSRAFGCLLIAAGAGLAWWR